MTKQVKLATSRVNDEWRIGKKGSKM